MRKFRYNEQGDDGENVVVTITEDEVFATYWPWWQEQMRKAGKGDEISREACIEDFLIVNWAWTVLE